MENKKYYVYEHINKLSNEVIYVGSGNIKRPYDFREKWRNKLWNEEIEKIGLENLKVNIAFECNDKNEALHKEELLTLFYVDSQQCFCNINIGNKASETVKYIASKTHKNKKISDEHKQKIKEWNRNNPWLGKKHSEETRKRISLANKGKKISEEHKKSISEKLSGNNHGMHKKGGHSEESKIKIKTAAKERFKNKENHPFYGKTHSEETRKKISESKKKNRIIKCKELSINFANMEEFNSLKEKNEKLKEVYFTPIFKNCVKHGKYISKNNLTFIMEDK